MADRTVKRARTCVGCGEQSQKTTLFRVVRCPDGTVCYDATGRLAGRGAYVCSAACLNDALKTKRLQRALKASIGNEEADRLVEQMLDAFDGATQR